MTLPILNENNYNPLNDVLFKFIFGKEERKGITIDFLNAILEKSLKSKIKDLTFSNTEKSPENQHEKLTRLDVACVLDNGEQVDIEVQVKNNKDMAKRTLYYWSQLYLTSLPAGKQYKDMKKCITINLVNFDFLPQKNPHSIYGVYNIENNHQLTTDLEIHFLEIPKYKKQPNKPFTKMNKMEKWLNYFANKLEPKEKEELAMSETAIRDAMEAARVFLNNTEERRQYINREMARMDYESDMYYSRKEGEKEGEKKGEKKGNIASTTKSVKTIMKKMGYDAQNAMIFLEVPENLKPDILKELQKN